MAVTGAIFNSLIYGGIDSADYGIYITGEAVYNAPERAVDLVAVPGRNGAIAIDQGHFENIEIEYPAGCFADDQTAFATAISDFRNAIMSQLGYQRLTDGYHPDEYRMALYIEGIEISPVRRDNGFAGEFTIKFNAKPQRWLTSGEDPVSVTSGDEITNPTLFEASPLLAAEGYGSIEFNGYVIELTNVVLGNITLFSGRSFSYYDTRRFSESLLNPGDTISFDSITLDWNIRTATGGSYSSYSATTTGAGTATTTVIEHTSAQIKGMTVVSGISFTAGAYGTKTITTTVSVTFSSYGTESVPITLTVTYSQGTIDFNLTFTPSSHLGKNKITCSYSELVGESTVTMLGHPTYIDCDLGEAYKIVDDEILSLNAYIDLGSDLPILASGTNEIIYDNTITSLEVAPRWWKI